MTFEQALQLLVAFGTILTTWQTTRRGYRVVLEKLTSYVTVEEYRTKTSDLHDKINSQAVQIARLEERAAK